jgi:hypothetical protein
LDLDANQIPWEPQIKNALKLDIHQVVLVKIFKIVLHTDVTLPKRSALDRKKENSAMLKNVMSIFTAIQTVKFALRFEKKMK